MRYLIIHCFYNNTHEDARLQIIKISSKKLRGLNQVFEQLKIFNHLIALIKNEKPNNRFMEIRPQLEICNVTWTSLKNRSIDR